MTCPRCGEETELRFGQMLHVRPDESTLIGLLNCPDGGQPVAQPHRS